MREIRDSKTRVEFPCKASSTGTGGLRLNIPSQILRRVLASNEDIAFFDLAEIFDESGLLFTMKYPKLSRGNPGRRYIIIPRKTIREYDIHQNQEFQVAVYWDER